MEKFFRFAARHPRWSRILILPPLLLLAIYLSSLDVPYGVIWVIVFTVIFPYALAVTMAAMFLMNPKVRLLNEQCDPAPLLETTAFLLTCLLSPAHRLVTSMNHAVALRELGAYEEAQKVMTGIDLTQPRKIPPMAKFVYFHNMADFLDHLGHTEEADAMHEKALSFWDAIPQKRKSPALENTVRLAQASACCRHGEFIRAVEILQDMNCADARQRVERGMYLARCAIALGQTDRAAQWLRYVMEHGSLLHMAAEARQMLEHLENS